jgi:hypothetical protein
MFVLFSDFAFALYQKAIDAYEEIVAKCSQGLM